MGMNYYLRATTPESISVLEKFPKFRVGESLLLLENGVVWNRKYYPSMEVLHSSGEYYATLHIGKNSYGWNFALRTYPNYGISTLEDWNRFFKMPGMIIYDEEDREVPTKEMLAKITQKEAKDWSEYSSQEEYEAAQVQEWNEYFNKEHTTNYLLAPSRLVKDYDDLLTTIEFNNATRGAKGLIGRTSSEYFKVIHVEGASYDLIPEEDNDSW